MLLTVTSTSGLYSPYGFFGLEISIKTAESGCGLGFINNISLITFKSCYVFLLSHFIYV
jgi:hypothetical protein